MKRFWPLILMIPFLAAPLVGKEKKPPSDVEYLTQMVSSAGGGGVFSRLETLSYEFGETLPVSEGRLIVSGRHFLKLHDEEGLRVREETRSPEGETLTLWNSSGVWHWRDGVAVEEEDVLSRVRRDIETKIFLLLLPHNIAEASCPVRYVGLGYHADKMGRRLRVEEPCPVLPAGTEGFVLFVDSGSYTLDGAVFEGDHRPEPGLVSFGAYRTFQNLSVPTQRAAFDADGERLSAFSMYNFAVNSYISETLMQPDRVEPAGK